MKRIGKKKGSKALPVIEEKSFRSASILAVSFSIPAPNFSPSLASRRHAVAPSGLRDLGGHQFLGLTPQATCRCPFGAKSRGELARANQAAPGLGSGYPTILIISHFALDFRRAFF